MGEIPGIGSTPPERSPGPRVAVVIPCFNHGEFVAEAVASALHEQEACEVVVVDDGSSDPDTLRVLVALAAAGVKVVHQENAGPAAARSAGVVATSAPYVQSLDADDRLAPGVVARLADALEAHPDAKMAWGPVESFGARAWRIPCRQRLDPWRISFLNEVPAAVLVERRALEAVGRWDETGYEDWDLQMKGAEAGWTGWRIDDVCLLYREHPGPRQLADLKSRDEENRRRLRRRHSPLFEDRGRSRRASDSHRAVKALWTLIDAVPLLSGLQRERLFVLSRDIFEPAQRKSEP